MSAPRSSGVCRYGVANVLSTTSERADLLRGGGDGRDVDDVERAGSSASRSRRGASLRSRGAAAPSESSAGRQVGERVALGLVDPREHAVDAAVDVVDADDPVTGVDEVHDRRRGSRDPTRRRGRGRRSRATRGIPRAPSASGWRPGRSRSPCARRLPPARTSTSGRSASSPRRSPDRAPARHGWRASRSPRWDRSPRVSALPGRSAIAARARGRSSVAAARARGRARRRALRDARTPSSRWNAFTTSSPVAALRLQVGSSDDPVAAEERQDVVAVAPLVRLLVDLDQVVEAEHAPGERAIPEEVVERGEQHGRRRRGQVELGAGRDEHGRAAVVDLHALEEPVRDEPVDRGPHALRAALEAPVLDDAGLGQRAARPDRPQRQRTKPLVLGRAPARRARRGGSTRSGQVVEALEARAGRRSRARRGSRAGRASPWRACAPTCPCSCSPSKSREASGPSRRIRSRISSRRCACVRSTCDHHGRPPPSIAVPEERPVLRGEQARLVRPVLEHAAAAQQPRHRVARVRADARRERRSGGCARPSRWSRAGRRTARVRPPRPRPRVPRRERPT